MLFSFKCVRKPAGLPKSAFSILGASSQMALAVGPALCLLLYFPGVSGTWPGTTFIFPCSCPKAPSSSSITVPSRAASSMRPPRIPGCVCRTEVPGESFCTASEKQPRKLLYLKSLPGQVQWGSCP